MNLKKSLVFLSFCLLLTSAVSVVFAQSYSPGVSVGQYVLYGNFIGTGPGVEIFNDYSWLKLEVIEVSGNEVTLLSVGQFKDGSPIPGNGTISVWNLETGTENGVPSTQGPIIAMGLNQGDEIPPSGTYRVNRTETRDYLGVSRSINILDVEISTPDYNTSLTYIYDQLSGMLLESKSETIQAQPEQVSSIYSYNIIETNIFGTSNTQSPSPTTPPTSLQPTQSPTQSPTQNPTSTPPSPLGGDFLLYLFVAIIVIVIVLIAALIILRKT